MSTSMASSTATPATATSSSSSASSSASSAALTTSPSVSSRSVLTSNDAAFIRGLRASPTSSPAREAAGARSSDARESRRSLSRSAARSAAVVGSGVPQGDGGAAEAGGSPRGKLNFGSGKLVRKLTRGEEARVEMAAATRLRLARLERLLAQPPRRAGDGGSPDSPARESGADGDASAAFSATSTAPAGGAGVAAGFDADRLLVLGPSPLLVVVDDTSAEASCTTGLVLGSVCRALDYRVSQAHLRDVTDALLESVRQQFGWRVGTQASTTLAAILGRLRREGSGAGFLSLWHKCFLGSNRLKIRLHEEDEDHAGAIEEAFDPALAEALLEIVARLPSAFEASRGSGGVAGVLFAARPSAVDSAYASAMLPFGVVLSALQDAAANGFHFRGRHLVQGSDAWDASIALDRWSADGARGLTAFLETLIANGFESIEEAFLVRGGNPPVSVEDVLVGVVDVWEREMDRMRARVALSRRERLAEKMDGMSARLAVVLAEESAGLQAALRVATGDERASNVRAALRHAAGRVCDESAQVAPAAFPALAHLADAAVGPVLSVVDAFTAEHKEACEDLAELRTRVAGLEAELAEAQREAREAAATVASLSTVSNDESVHLEARRLQDEELERLQAAVRASEGRTATLDLAVRESEARAAALRRELEAATSAQERVRDLERDLRAAREEAQLRAEEVRQRDARIAALEAAPKGCCTIA